MNKKIILVSVPNRGLFNLTLYLCNGYFIPIVRVSVPIRGLFNLTNKPYSVIRTKRGGFVFVPIRGLFNLTLDKIVFHDFTS